MVQRTTEETGCDNEVTRMRMIRWLWLDDYDYTFDDCDDANEYDDYYDNNGCDEGDGYD